MSNILQEILDIDRSKKCLDFLLKRITSNNYRGVHTSQHNRYTQNEILIILQEIYRLCPNSLLQIRTTDSKKRPLNTQGEEQYAQLTHNLALKLGRCTQDSLRKNLFVDMHRMGLIDRFNAKKEALIPFQRGAIKYIALTPLALEILNAEDIFHQNLLYTKALESLMNGFGEEVLQLILALDSHYISQDELLFFGTFLYQRLGSYLYGKEDILYFINEYRTLSKFQKQALRERIKQYCEPKNFNGDKTQKRDFHNWLNETQQILHLLTQMAYFEYREERLFLRIGKDSLYQDNAKLKRSLSQKYSYFKNHKIIKTKGFELHHIVPLCWAKTRNEFNVLDNWQNLVYIDGYSHAKITQNRNANVQLSFDEQKAIFTDFAHQKIECEKQKQILYDEDKESVMLNYNQHLLARK